MLPKPKCEPECDDDDLKVASLDGMSWPNLARCEKCLRYFKVYIRLSGTYIGDEVDPKARNMSWLPPL